MNIGIIGTGRMGSTLAKRWIEHGHHIYFGSRDAEKAQAQAQAIDPARVQGGTAEDAVNNSEVVVLAMPYLAALETAQNLSLDGKIVIDITNAIGEGMNLAVGLTTSAAEAIAAAAPDAHVVKALNGIQQTILDNPDFDGEQPFVPICGDDEHAKRTVHELISQLGLHVEDVGGIQMARYVEPFAMLWIKMAYQQGFGVNFAFKMLKRDG